MKQKPDCRYGHGDLVDVDRMDGVPVTFGLFVQKNQPHENQSQMLTGVKWFVCKVCGYSELQDTDPAQTFLNMGNKP